ncbi:MAG: amidohydrolase [Lachnospiraceae bacterium]|jgi:amidohydrolase|nr:amidohydrolase [Lachnospiraceae bacterium]
MSNQIEWISSEVDEVFEDMRMFREELHKHPELSGEEIWTRKQIIEKLEEYKIPYENAGRTSIVATIKGGKPGKTVALRADMDALPIDEASDVVFKSEEKGKMHACGHDSHSTVLLFVGKILKKHQDEITGTVKLIFQEAEETFEGAKKIVEEGFVDEVDGIFGMHNMTNYPLGKAIAKKGSLYSGCNTIYVTFTGVSGHGSTPYLAKDSLTPACIFANDLGGIITKNTDAQKAVVVSVGKLVGGTKANIVAKETKLDISMRYFDEEVCQTVVEAIKRHGKAIASMYQVDFDIEVVPSTYSVFVNSDLADISSGAIKKIMGEEAILNIEPLMNSEDFSYYLKKCPGAYIIMGSGNDKDCIYPMHHEKYKMAEDYMKYAAKVMLQVVFDFL